MDFPYNEHSRLADILKAHPWLIRELPAYEPRLSALRKPTVRAMLRRYTVADVSRFTGYPVEKLLDKLARMIQEHE